MTHVVLLGDSVFDNRAYVAPAPDVVHQLRRRLGGSGQATLLAVDGNVTRDVAAGQLQRPPGDATHLIVSVGGNDALGHAGLLNAPARSIGEQEMEWAEPKRWLRFNARCSKTPG